MDCSTPGFSILPEYAPGVCSNSCPLSQWCYLTHSSFSAPSYSLMLFKFSSPSEHTEYMHNTISEWFASSYLACIWITWKVWQTQSFWFRRSGLWPKNLHFEQVPKFYRCCWFRSHIFQTTGINEFSSFTPLSLQSASLETLSYALFSKFQRERFRCKNHADKILCRICISVTLEQAETVDKKSNHSNYFPSLIIMLHPPP